MGLCSSRGGWLCDPYQTPQGGKSLWMIPRREMRIWNFGARRPRDDFGTSGSNDYYPGQLIWVQFNHSYAFQCIEGEGNVVHFRAVEVNGEAPDSPPPLHDHVVDPLLDMSELLLCLQSMQNERYTS